MIGWKPLFYTNIQGKPYPGFEYQDYKDKGFNIKLRIKKEGALPAIAVGLNDFAGTGFYSSEYIVSSYGINNFDFHFGLGWGQLNGANKKIKNPFGYIKDSFYDRPLGTKGEEECKSVTIFSDMQTSPFYGISYLYNDNLLLKFEKDPILVNGPRMPYEREKVNFQLV